MRLFSTFMLTTLFAGMFVAVRIIPVKAVGIIYIRADGSVDPPTAPIATVDNCTYVLSGNVTDQIVIERNNIILDGRREYGYGIHFTDVFGSAITLSGRTNVTIRNTEVNLSHVDYAIRLSGTNECVVTANTIYDMMGICLISVDGYANTISQNTAQLPGINNQATIRLSGSLNIVNDNNIIGGTFGYGLVFGGSSNSAVGNTIWAGDDEAVCLIGSNNTLRGNDISGFSGIILSSSSDNSIVDNEIVGHNWDGVHAYNSDHNYLIGNEITAGAGDGLLLSTSSDNSIIGNNITSGGLGVGISLSSSSNNSIFHNNIVGKDLYDASVSDGRNVWDDGYPSGGNYWKHYVGPDLYRGPYQNETGSDDIIDIPFLIAPNNTDWYPSVSPYNFSSPLPDVAVTSIFPSKTVIPQDGLASINVTAENQGPTTATFNLTLQATYIYYPLTLAFALEANATQGWNHTIPGPPICANLGDTISLELISKDSLSHKFYVDYNGNSFPDSDEPQSNPFIYTNLTMAFSANRTGTFRYYCAYNQDTMFGDLVVNAEPQSNRTWSQSVTLHIREQENSRFECSFTGMPLGNYTLHAYATPIPWETDTSDNAYIGGTVTLRPLIRDIAVTSATACKHVVGQGYSACINVSLENHGELAETFNVTAYANSTIIGTSVNIILASGDSATHTFVWNASGFAFGNYTISAYATSVQDETEISDNTFVDGWILVSIPGDINADRKVDLKDVFVVARALGSERNNTDGSYWHTPRKDCCPHSPSCDINNDGKIDLKDYYITCKNYSKSW